MNSTLLLERLDASSPSERYDVVLDVVCAITADMLDNVDLVNPQCPYRDYGLSSRGAVELVHRLSATSGFELAAALLSDNPTPAAVATYLLSRFEPHFAGTEDVVDRSRLAPHLSDQSEPIAIVGMGCRCPGGVGTPEQLWHLVSAGTDVMDEFPEDRSRDRGALYRLDPAHPCTVYAGSDGSLDDISGFDAEFFRIGSRETTAMDPRQRLLLEGVWNTFEHAGLAISALAGTRTGVFLGRGDAYSAQSDSDGSEGDRGTGAADSGAAGRVAHTFGLAGPTVNIDTAGASSLMAIHLAMRSLRAGESALALAGGVTAMAIPEIWPEFGEHGALSPGRGSRSFAADSNGIAWSEGVGLVLLERMSDAVRNRRRILAVMRGPALNQDGHSSGMTAPLGAGPTLGDPTEAGAIMATYRRDRSGRSPLLLGPLKSNIGSAQAASGVGGLIKMVLALRHGRVPPTLHADRPTHTVDRPSGAVESVREPVNWRRGGRPRRAGVSALGAGGTNAHVVVEEAPYASEPVSIDDGIGPVAWVLSARTPAALTERVRRLTEFLDAQPDLEVAEVASALAAQEQGLACRVVAVGGCRDELIAELHATEATVRPEHPEVGHRGKVAFVFPGTGSQWPGMAAELLESSPIFARTFRACAGELCEHLTFSPEDLESTVRGAAGALPLDRADVVQPALFAMMVSLAAVWRSYGVEPDVVVGHSRGEIAAAHIAGGLSLADAAAVVAVGSTAGAREARPGAMITVFEVVSRAGQTTFCSSVTGSLLDNVDLDARHWNQNLRRTVRFESAISGLVESGVETFVEISPHPVLVAAIADVVNAAPVDSGRIGIIGSISRSESGPATLLRSAGKQFMRGLEVDWRSAYPSRPDRVDLPLYPFERTRYRGRPGATSELNEFGVSSVSHPLLTGMLRPGGEPGRLWVGQWSLDEQPWLADHLVDGVVIVPGTAFVEVVAYAAAQLGHSGIEELHLEAPLRIPDRGGVRIQVWIGAVDESGRRSVTVHSRPVNASRASEESDRWVRYAMGALARTAAPEVAMLVQWPPTGAVPLDTSMLYLNLAERGLEYGPAFQNVRAAWSAEAGVVQGARYAEVALAAEKSAAGAFHVAHPVLLDAALHISHGYYLADSGVAEAWIPCCWRDVYCHSSRGARSSLRVRLHRTGERRIAMSVVDEHGGQVLSAGVVAPRPVAVASLPVTQR
ncbi:beta-ketoacyl synthase N-terminal-like domain-containing protein [Nocardia halotolerans]|uniref:Beta-ketoacyl synthase N-terminal-like domain-containing protein n=1 Tax=Nocardia halotolerans TaxID=1755878 RepID=A0ABV8VJ55_9NOCA